MRIGVDTGGTFTDLVLVDGDICLTHKLLSTPAQPGEAVLCGIAELLGGWQQRLTSQRVPDVSHRSRSEQEPHSDRSFPASMRVVHGSTVATNALLEGKGGRVAWVTTAGFEDILWLGRQARPTLYELAPQQPPRPLSRSHVLGVPERVRYDGRVLVSLSSSSVDEIIASLKRLDFEAIAICLLHSYANPAHEQALAAACRSEFPGTHVTASCELVKEFREFERASTTLVNAVAAPPMCRYIGGLREELGGDALRIMASAGGVLPPSSIEAAPAHTIVSGPAGGVVGALHMAQQAGFNEIITFDMGGTSTDVSLCQGKPSYTMDGGIAGLPVRLPMFDIETVGAGGGSVAWIDAGGALQVGPMSLGASPGPACYGAQEGPLRAAVTDAHLVVGHLFDGQLMASSLPLQARLARAAIAPLADAMGMSVESAALGILDVAEAVMARAIQRISTQKGSDPRAFVLLPFGGAGGLHACRLAEAMGMSHVLLPPHAGLLSAVGMLAAPPRYELSQGVMIRCIRSQAMEGDPIIAEGAEIEQALASLQRQLEATISADGDEPSLFGWEASLDIRYVGQSYELRIPFGAIGDEVDSTGPMALFEAEHARLYGYDAPERGVEVVAVRLVAERPSTPPDFRTAPNDDAPAAIDVLASAPAQRIFTPLGWVEGRRVVRSQLPTGACGQGPIVLVEPSGTTVIPDSWEFEVLPCGSISLCHTEASTAAKASAVEGTDLPREDGAGEAVDAIELSVFQHLFASIAEEMGARLQRAAYSPNIKERLDFSCALFDGAGAMIAQAAHIPVHLGATQMSVEAILDAFPPASMTPADRFVVNDPYAGGTHLPDITVVAPCFCEGDEVPRFFVANRAHHADVGGVSPGSMPLSRHIDDEGIRIAPQRLDQACMDWICEQTRTPDERRGDLQAQSAALQVGCERLQALAARHGAQVVSARAEALQTYTAAMMAAVIQSLPDGSYTYVDYLDHDGFSDEPVAIHCAVTIQGDQATVDWSGSDEQVVGPLNAVRAIALSAVNYVFCCLAPAEVPANAGVMAAIEVKTRPGSVVDALPPSPVAGGNVETSQRLVDALMGALAQAVPGRIPAASCGSMNNITIGGVDPRSGASFAYYETLAGGVGAGPSGPGADALHTHMTNTRNTPIEALEHAYPFRILRYELRQNEPDGANPSLEKSLHKGGRGVCRAYVFESEAEVTLLTERRTRSPYGLQGGASGAMGRNILRRANGHVELLPGKCSFVVGAGDVIEIHTPGGGSWGQKT